MSIFSKILGTDKAISGVVDIGKKGMDMWDMSKFTPQEQVAAFERLAKVTGSRETAISRRIIIWVLTGIIALAFVIGSIWVGFGSLEKVDSLVDLIHALKVDWAFAAGIAFYFLTHVVGGIKK